MSKIKRTMKHKMSIIGAILAGLLFGSPKALVAQTTEDTGEDTTRASAPHGDTFGIVDAECFIPSNAVCTLLNANISEIRDTFGDNVELKDLVLGFDDEGRLVIYGTKEQIFSDGGGIEMVMGDTPTTR